MRGHHQVERQPSVRAFESLEETSNHALSPHPIQHNHVTRYPYHAIYYTTTSYRGMIPTLPPILAILSLHTFASHRARRCHSRYYSLCSLRPRLAHSLWGWVCVSAMCGEVTCPPHPSPLSPTSLYSGSFEGLHLSLPLSFVHLISFDPRRTVARAFCRVGESDSGRVGSLRGARGA